MHGSRHSLHGSHQNKPHGLASAIRFAHLPTKTSGAPMTQAELQTAPGSRGRALASVAAMFTLYFVLVRVIRHFIAPKLNTISMPVGAPDMWWHVLLSLTAVAIATLLAVLVPLWIYLHLRGRHMRELGLDRAGTRLAWLLVLAVQGGLIWLQLRNPMGPLARAPDPLNIYALAGSLIIAPAAALAEEIFFRGYIMDELKRGGFGAALQILISMLLFGTAHVTLASADWTIPVFTGILGGFWSLIYVLSKRSLWPSIVGHVLNDAVMVPSAIYMVMQYGGGYY